MTKPFRFGVGFRDISGPDQWAASAREAEELGYSTMHFADHFVMPDALAALVAAALATSTIRIGTYVLCNDFRHPAVLAREAATVDVLSGGRFELGLGAGWLREEYDQAGIAFDPPSVRIRRLGEALQILKGLFGGPPCTFEGEHYTVRGLSCVPLPVQQPHPPLLVGGAGKRMLSLAAREADIIAFAVGSTPQGLIDCGDMRRSALDRKIELVREAAGSRLEELELNTMITGPVFVTDDRDGTAPMLLDFMKSGEIPMVVPDDFTEVDILDSPHLLVGSIGQIVDQLVEQRDCYGISYVTVIYESLRDFAPIVEKLAGT